jgi:hypothetical protein
MLAVLRRDLAPRGTLVLAGGDRYDRPVVTGMNRQLRATILSMFTGQRLRPLLARETRRTSRPWPSSPRTVLSPR